MKLLLLATLAGCLIAPFLHAQSRGVWFWGSTTLPDGDPSPWGSSDVVGNAALENNTINFLVVRHVDRIYGSYQNRPVSEAATIAAWNAKLAANGIQSQLLLSGSAVNDPATVSSLQGKVTNRLINFNNAPGRLENEKFKALHLDLEPQQLTAWNTGTPTDKRNLLIDLKNVYVLIRDQLDLAGFTTMPIYADIPFTWDKLPADGGSVGWTSAADRDNWFSDIAAELDGVSLMTFSKDTSAALQTATAYERSSALAGKAVIAIQPKVGPSELWTSYAAFTAVMTLLEADVPTSEATDIENYAFWRHAISTTGGIPTLSGVFEVAPAPGGSGGGVVIVHAEPGYLYIVKSSPDLEQWGELARVRTQSTEESETITLPFQMNDRAGFFKTEVIKER